jgi:hyaluronate lyase
MVCARGAVTLVNDPFSDGSRSNAAGGDALGLVYYMGTAGGALTVTNDASGIGAGNALLYAPDAGAGFGKYLAYFGPVTLANAGDSITLRLDYRFLRSPPNLSAGLRIGLYNAMGTRQLADGATTASGPGNRNDDVGYGFQTNPGLASASGTSAYSEAAGNDILGGASPSHTAGQGTAGASVNSGTARHSALLQISLQAGGDLLVSAQVDGGAMANTTIPAASVLARTFDELCIGEGGTGFDVPWLVDNVSLASTTADDFDKLRTAWWTLQTGGTNYSLTNLLVKTRLTSITNTANSYWNSMDKTGTNAFLWSDYASTTDSAHISGCYSRLRAMALAYATPGSYLRSNATLAADIQLGLNWLYARRYNQSVAAPAGEYDNWYDWEIGAPLQIADIAVFMYDGLGITGLSNTLNAMDHFVPSPFGGTLGTSTGGNLTDKIRTVAVRAAVVKDAAKLAAARDAFSAVFPYVITGDGFYRDGSFIQHRRHPYNGSYGAVLLADVALVLPWLAGSPWQCMDAAQTNVLQWVYNSYEPFLYSGAMMDMTRGRAVSRSSSQDHAAGTGILQSLLTLAVSAFPPPADVARMKSMIKQLALADTFRSFTNNAPLQLVAASQQLMADGSVTPRGPLAGHWTFGSMDRAVHLRPTWGLGLSASSSRIYNYESINSENLHGWFQGEGMTYLYNNDLAQFSDDFWPTVDPYRLPGTTVDTAARANASGQGYLSARNWVGGATLLTNGVYGMDIGPYNSSLTAKKSWFMFDDEVICLGAGITCSGGASVQTTPVNRKISASNTNVLMMDGVTMPATLGWQTNRPTTWCYLEGFGGCYFPGGAVLNAVRQARSASWSQINASGTTNLTTKNYLTLWIDHGIKPTNSSYAYALLPNYTSGQSVAYAANPKFTILENSTNAQAIQETSLDVVGANFWTDGPRSAGLITVNKRASVMTQETPATLSLAVSDPTQTNAGAILVTLDRAGNSVIAMDSAITLVRLRPTIQVSVNVAGSLGRTFVARFNLQNTAPSLAPVSNRTLSAGVTLSVTNTATDADIPYQYLLYSLVNPPPGATINPNSGVITWRPPANLAGASNLVTVVVMDNGSPSLSATQSFTVFVNPLNAPRLAPAGPAGSLAFRIEGDAGPDYLVQASTNLVDWQTVFATNPAVLPFTWSESSGGGSGPRFYRIQLSP